MCRTAVPIAAVNKDSQFRRTEDNVRRPAELGQWLGRNSVPQPLSVQEPAH